MQRAVKLILKGPIRYKSNDSTTDRVTQLISNIVNAKKGGKTLVKIEIEFIDD